MKESFEILSKEYISNCMIEALKARLYKGIEADNALELVLREAEANMAAGEQLNPKIITPIRAAGDDNDTLAHAVGISAEPIDWTKALERLEKAKNG